MVRRIVGTALALGALAYCLTNWATGDRFSLGLLVVAGMGFGVAGWLHPLSPHLFPSLVASLLVLAWAARQWWVTGVAVAVILGLLYVGLRRLTSGVDPDSLTIADADAVMRGAEPWIEELQTLGFRHVASISAQVRNVVVISSLLLSGDRASFASVTDAVMSMTSVFADGRTLVTRTSAFAMLPPWMLDNPALGASPIGLTNSHASALALVAERGAVPEEIAEDELAALALSADLRHIRWMDSHPHRIQDQSKAEPVWQRLGRYQEVEDWLADPVPPMQQTEPRPKG